MHDLLSTVNKPEWPAAELLLSLLGRLLVSRIAYIRCLPVLHLPPAVDALSFLQVHQFSNKQTEMALRVASLDYLGTVASRLRKDAVTISVDQKSIDRILRGVETFTLEDTCSPRLFFNVASIQRCETFVLCDELVPSQIPGDDEVQQLQKALLDYLDEHNETDSALMVCSCVFFVNTLRIQNITGVIRVSGCLRLLVFLPFSSPRSFTSPSGSETPAARQRRPSSLRMRWTKT